MLFEKEVGISKKSLRNKKRIYGEHLTSIHIFEKFILPEIKNKIYDYLWIDLFCGEGNLILPILNLLPEEKRIEFLKIISSFLMFRRR